MKNVAFIPARGGSKGIKEKNIMPVFNKPLIYWTAKACENAGCIEKIYISTDSEKIKQTVNDFGFSKIEVISRSPETATDTATSESALIEFCKNYIFDNVIFLQATSPLTDSKDIDSAFDKFLSQNADSMLSVVKNYQFLWDTKGAPLNYNPQNRPRRQDWDGYYIENGAFYLSKRENILKSNCRISGKISYYEMPSNTLFEIDEPADKEIIEKLLSTKI